MRKLPRIDVEATKSGKWFANPEAGIRALIARSSGREAAAKIRAILKRFPDTSQEELEQNPEFLKATAAIYANHVLLDIEPLREGDEIEHPYKPGEALDDYTPQLGTQMLDDPAYEWLYQWVQRKSGRLTAFLEADVSTESAAGKP